MISALLITGGYRKNRNGDLSSAELWAPTGSGSTGLSCSLAPMVSARYGHSLTGSGLACGGCDDWDGVRACDARTSCESFSEGSWRLLETRLSKERHYHSAWLQRSTNTTFLLGGLESSTRSVETVSNEGKSDRADFVLAHNV